MAAPGNGRSCGDLDNSAPVSAARRPGAAQANGAAMNATIILDPVRVDTGSADRDGLLAYRNGALIGVLTHLDPDLHEEEGVGRHWFLEAGFGRVAEAPRPRPFRSLDEARSWLRQHAAGVTPRCAAAIL